MIKYVIFTEQELKNMLNNIPVMDSHDHNPALQIAYVSQEYYENMMSEMQEKEINDD